LQQLRITQLSKRTMLWNYSFCKSPPRCHGNGGRGARCRRDGCACQTQQRGTTPFTWALILWLQTAGEEGFSGVCIAGLFFLCCQHYGQYVLNYGHYVNFLPVSGGKKRLFSINITHKVQRVTKLEAEGSQAAG